MWPPGIGVWTIISPRHAMTEKTREPTATRQQIVFAHVPFELTAESEEDTKLCMVSMAA